MISRKKISGLKENYQPLVKSVLKIANSVLAVFGRLPAGRRRRDCRAEIFLISDAQMRALNRSFRHKDGATNVLSFPAAGFFRPDLKGDFLGEVYLAPAFIAARNQNFSKLVIHGLLHLFGYDHKKKSDRMEMEYLEEKIFQELKK